MVRKQNRLPVRVVGGERFRTKRKAEKEADEWNRAFKPRRDIKFVVRKEGWNRKKTYS